VSPGSPEGKLPDYPAPAVASKKPMQARASPPVRDYPCMRSPGRLVRAPD